MLSIKVHCSACPEETEVVVDDLDAVEREVCDCGYNFVVVSVAEFSPVHGGSGKLLALPERHGGRGDDRQRRAA
jgi:hypothetical protein